MVFYGKIKKIADGTNNCYKKDLIFMINCELQRMDADNLDNHAVSGRFTNYFYNHGLADKNYAITREDLEKMLKILSA